MFPIASHQGSGPMPAEMNEKIDAIDRAIEVEEQGDKAFDPENDEKLLKRPFLLTHAMLVGLAMVLVVVVEMACLAKVSVEYQSPKEQSLTVF